MPLVPPIPADLWDQIPPAAQAAGQTFGAAKPWPWHKDAEGKTVCVGEKTEPMPWHICVLYFADKKGSGKDSGLETNASFAHLRDAYPQIAVARKDVVASRYIQFVRYLERNQKRSASSIVAFIRPSSSLAPRMPMMPASVQRKTERRRIMGGRFTSGKRGISAIGLSWCLLTLALTTRQAWAVAPSPLCLERLASMSWCELEQLYRQATPGTIPAGYLRGRAIYCQGAPLSLARSKVSQALWHGKHFCPDDGTLINLWCLRTQAVRARVCYGESWLDGRPSIVMDYRGMSQVWGDVRDEMREVGPGLYLGLMYRCKAGQPQRKLFFALEKCSCPPWVHSGDVFLVR